MKARSASMTLYHFQPGHHKEVCLWHDSDHKPEVVGTMPHVFISQRWVAPPDWMDLRGPTELPQRGGEYVNLYWSSGSVQEMTDDFDYLGKRLGAVGRMGPMKYIERTWGGRLRPVSVQTSPGRAQSGEAVTGSTMMTGLLVVIGLITDDSKRGDYLSWHEHEHMPLIMESRLFAGAAKLMSENPNEYIALYYTDDPDPKKVYAEFQKLMAGNRGKDFPNADAVRKRVLGAMYRPSMGQYEFYD
ncbi:MAG TPA: hypothetical protein VFS62_04135 [Chloroflexota bacterium]|nr:hypothetical protein [Chloroflexota bacterium]